MQKEVDRRQKVVKNISGVRTGARQKSHANKQNQKSNAQKAADADNDSTAAKKHNTNRRRGRQKNGRKSVHFS